MPSKHVWEDLANPPSYAGHEPTLADYEAELGRYVRSIAPFPVQARRRLVQQALRSISHSGLLDG